MMEADEGINNMRGLRINSQIYKEAKDWLMRRNVLRLPANARFEEFREGRKFIIPIEGYSWSRDSEEVISFLLEREEDLWMVELRIKAISFEDRMDMLRTMLGRLWGKGVRNKVRFQVQACEFEWVDQRRCALPSRELSILDVGQLGFLRFLRALEGEMKDNWKFV